jgi:hypothetical protein
MTLNPFAGLPMMNDNADRRRERHVAGLPGNPATRGHGGDGNRIGFASTL